MLDECKLECHHPYSCGDGFNMSFPLIKGKVNYSATEHEMIHSVKCPVCLNVVSAIT